MKILSRHWGTGKAITESDGLHQIQRDPEDGSGDEDCSWTSLALRLKIFYHFPDGAAFDATTSRDTDFKQQRLQHLTGFTDITSCVRLFFVSNVNKDIFLLLLLANKSLFFLCRSLVILRRGLDLTTLLIYRTSQACDVLNWYF